MTWNVDPSQFTVTVRSDLARVRNDAALLGLRGLMLRTPVDTGRARGGWTVGVDQIRNEDPGAGQQGSSLASGVARIAGTANDPYATIYISNNVPYIKYLNNGTRYIRPHRFLEITFNDIRVRFG